MTTKAPAVPIMLLWLMKALNALFDIDVVKTLFMFLLNLMLILVLLMMVLLGVIRLFV